MIPRSIRMKRPNCGHRSTNGRTITKLPRELVHKLAIRESTHRPWAVNRPYYGLLQILPATARSMGYSGNAQGLLDADTNLEFAGKYLRGAWLLSDGDQQRAIFLYAKGILSGSQGARNAC